MDNSCEQIVRQKGVGWLFEKRLHRKGCLLRDALGVRDEGLQDIHVYRACGSSCVVIPNSDVYADLGTGSYTIGCMINFPTGSKNGLEHVVFTAGTTYLYEKNGNLYYNVNGNIVSTESSGLDFCDANTYYVKVYREQTGGGIRIGISILNKCKYELNIAETYISFLTSLVLGAYAVGSVYSNYLVNGTYLSGFYIWQGWVTSKDEDLDYWLHGIVPAGTQLFLKLDENVGSSVFDCSGNMNTGVIEGYAESCRGVHSKFFSWQNMFGYSDGDAGVLIPSMINSKLEDIYEVSLDHPGRVRVNTRLEDMTALSANGMVWGLVMNPNDLHLRPGQDEFAILAVFEKKSTAEGVVLCVGDRYKLEFISGDLAVTIGGVQSTVTISTGMHTYLVNVGLLNCDVYVDNVLLDTFVIGDTYSSGGVVSLLSENGASILNAGDIAFIGVRENILNENEVTIWFETLELSGTFRSAYYFGTLFNVVFDISGNFNHAFLNGYTADVWSGVQSVIPYIANGYTALFQSRQNMVNPVIVPYTLNGEKIYWNVYGASQVEVEYVDDGGLLLTDCWVNFNPENKVIGFWSEFWNKNNTLFWGNLDPRYITVNPYKWKIRELYMDYLLNALKREAYNYLFVGNKQGKFNVVVDLFDLVLLNMGNNVEYKPIPL